MKDNKVYMIVTNNDEIIDYGVGIELTLNGIYDSEDLATKNLKKAVKDFCLESVNKFLPKLYHAISDDEANKSAIEDFINELNNRDFISQLMPINDDSDLVCHNPNYDSYDDIMSDINEIKFHDLYLESSYSIENNIRIHVYKKSNCFCLTSWYKSDDGDVFEEIFLSVHKKSDTEYFINSRRKWSIAEEMFNTSINIYKVPVNHNLNHDLGGCSYIE